MTVDREDPTACAHCGSLRIEQDPDVLDTWFSSGLWPFSTLGWPAETPDFKYFYPTTMMETGYDILFFWVARMIMMGLEFTGDVPFSTVYLHGLIRDEIGRKMSKTYGNVIDPLTLMDELGTDALRFTLLVGSAPGNDMNLSVKRVEANRNFANKLWNASRFVISSIQDAARQGEKSISRDLQADHVDSHTPIPFPISEWSLADRWIYARTGELVRDVERLFQSYQYGEAGRQIYEFFWNEFADWYVEIAKIQLVIEKGAEAKRASKLPEAISRPTTPITISMLVYVLDTCLRMLHPFTPFVTEELWDHLKSAVLEAGVPYPIDEQALIVARWPEAPAIMGWENQSILQFAMLQDLVRAIRNLRAEKNVEPGKRIPAIFAAGELAPLLRTQVDAIAALAKLDKQAVMIQEKAVERKEGYIVLVVNALEVYLPLAELVDYAEERSRLERELAQAEGQIDRLQELLGSPFSEKAPQAVVQKEREKLALYRETVQKLKDQLRSMG
jgi:valyl-tRNA synthetase